METESSLPWSPATGPYPEPGPSIPVSLTSILMLSFHLHLGLSSDLFSSEIQTETL